MPLSPANLFKVARHFGIREAFFYAYRVLFKKKAAPPYLFVDGCRYPIAIRLRSSDYLNFDQIFLKDEYAALAGTTGVRLVVDCGAYIGLSSLWFLRRFPDARIVAIEPDEENFRMCQKNLKFHKKSVMLVNAAVWGHKTKLVAERGAHGDGLDWSTRVREPRARETPSVESITIDEVIRMSGFETADILKIDIERAEIRLFSGDFGRWLDKTGNIVIELHDAECERAFFNALSGYKYDVSRAGDIVICRNIRRSKE